MPLTDNALLILILDLLKEADAEHVEMTAGSMSKKLSAQGIEASRVESAILALKQSRQISVDRGGILHPTMPRPNRGRL